MSSLFLRRIPGLWRSVLVIGAVTCTLVGQARVLDDFNDNTKTDWADFTFVDGFGLPSETGGQFQFDLPPAGQDIFTASQKISELFELKEGRTIEFSVDLVQSSGEDAYAVLAFIPDVIPNVGPNTPGTLAGYGLAKDPTDVLITKGVQRYFVADDGPGAELPNEDIRLVLRLVAKDGNVTVTGQVINRGDGTVLWEQTVVDTPSADVMADGSDEPAAPFFTTGYFTLYCYQQFNAAIGSYTIAYDNAEVTIHDETVPTVLDDFDDNTKTDWTDFTFIDGFGLPTETDGQFVFDLPPAGQDIFTASQKTSRKITLTEGATVELRVDVVESSGEDAYAVLAFIPDFIPGVGENTPGSLAGYGLAKDPTDVLITKGIQKYFVADDGVTAELPNSDITLSLTLSVAEGNVAVTGKVINRGDGAVLWEQTVVDTPAADVMADGSDDPAAPFITSGYFTLYCYQQFNAGIGTYRLAYDNAVLLAPSLPENTAPVVSGVQPAAFANFLPAATTVAFDVMDDNDLSDDRIKLTLNGTVVDISNGLSLTGTGPTRSASWSGLQPDTNYKAVIEVEDSEALKTTRVLYFDTFLSTDRVVEVEDYNYESGQFINDPIVIVEGGYDVNSYSTQVGVEGIDFHDRRTSATLDQNPYRYWSSTQSDPVRTAHSLDLVRAKYSAAGGQAAGVYEYDVGDIEADEWLNYTRNFTAGTYEVYLRQALANMASAESRLELVTSNPAQTGQTTTWLGSFLGAFTGFQYRNFPLTDGSGLGKVIVRLNGQTTLRLHQVTPDADDGARLQNYMVFVPVLDPGTLRPLVSSVSPLPGSTVKSLTPVIQASIINRETSVKIDTVQVFLNDQPVAATVTAIPEGASIVYAVDPLPPSGMLNTARITYLDGEDVETVRAWQFTLIYNQLDPRNRLPGSGESPGFNVRVVYAPPGTDLDDTLQRAEEQLAPDSTISIDYETTVITQTINYSQSGPGSSDGSFPDDEVIPDIIPSFTDLIAMEVTTYLDLSAGVHRLGVHCDDGFKVQSGASWTDINAAPLAFSNDPSNVTFDLLVPQAGLYPFRVVWFEQGGDAHLEWFEVDADSGTRTLLNAPGASAKAYLTVAPPTLVLESSGSLTDTFAEEASANIDEGARRITVEAQGSARFYRIRGDSESSIQTIAVEGTTVTLSY